MSAEEEPVQTEDKPEEKQPTGLLGKVHSIGKKVSGAISSGISLGKKVTEKVHTIAKKVAKVAQIAEKVPFLPKSTKETISKVAKFSRMAEEKSGKVQKGIERGEVLQKKAQGVKSLTGALKVGREAAFEAKNLYKGTRAVMNRPVRGDPTKPGQKRLQPEVSNAVRREARKPTRTAVRGLTNAEVAKASAAAQQARALIARGGPRKMKKAPRRRRR